MTFKQKFERSTTKRYEHFTMEKFCYMNIINVGRFVCRLLNWRAQGESANAKRKFQMGSGLQFTRKVVLISGLGRQGPLGSVLGLQLGFARQYTRT